jgi:hypothetical protein
MLKLFGHAASICRKAMHEESWWRNIIRVATSKNKGSLREINCDDGRWTELLAKDHSQWWVGLDVSGFCCDSVSYVLCEPHNNFKNKILIE